jgi:hypothetical protein
VMVCLPRKRCGYDNKAHEPAADIEWHGQEVSRESSADEAAVKFE